MPTLASVAAASGSVTEVLTDSGFCSEAAVGQIEHNDQGQPTGITVLAAVGRKAHGRTVADLKKQADPPAPPADAPFTERMAHRTATAAGKTRYKLRQQTVEPVFGVIKEAIGFRRFFLFRLSTWPQRRFGRIASNRREKATSTAQIWQKISQEFLPAGMQLIL